MSQRIRKHGYKTLGINVFFTVKYPLPPCHYLAALAQANADKAKAEREAAKAAEQARREAEQARREADARAREAERRGAEARAQANRQLSRNTACDHVYVGKEFEARGGVLRLKNRYVVVGVSGRSSLATIRSKYSDYRQEVICYDIP